VEPLNSVRAVLVWLGGSAIAPLTDGYDRWSRNRCGLSSPVDSSPKSLDICKTPVEPIMSLCECRRALQKNVIGSDVVVLIEAATNC
jgi:hypothetical protein